MSLTITQQNALNAFLATLGVEGNPIPWWRDNSSPVPTEPLADVTNVAEIKRYMAHGYKTNLTHGVAPEDWQTMLNYCDKIAAAGSPQERDAVIAGAGHFAPDVAINIVLGGGTQGGGFSPLTIFAPWNSNFDMAQSAAWLTALPGTAGPGY